MDTMLLAERRRNRRVNMSLVGVALAAGIAVSNERGIFVPIGGIDDAVAATARAFTATATEPTPQIDTLYTPPVALRQVGGAPAYRRIVDVPGDTTPSMFDQPQAFTARAPDETPPADATSPSGGSAVPASTSTPPTFASLVAPTTNTPALVSQPAATGGGTTDTSDTNTIDPTAPTTNTTTPAPATATTSDETPPVAAIPEPASWLTMIAGFGIVGALRRRRRALPPGMRA